MDTTLFRRIALAWALTILLAPLAVAQIDFNKQVRPILANHCLQCHGPDSQNRQADLRLDTETEAKRSAILAGQAEQSPLVQRIE
jgi:cytochrome c553